MKEPRLPNRNPDTQRFKKVRSTFLVAAALLFAAAASPSAQASQDAKVVSASAEVHQFPNASSPTIANLPKDAKIRISSDLTRDVRGEYWYKVKVPTGEYGYIRVPDVKGNELDRELKVAGVSPPQSEAENPDAGELPWSFVIRGMGLAGFSSGPSAFEGGGEAELSSAIFLGAHGYKHRMLSLGAAMQYFSANDLAVLGSLIYRIFTPVRTEPEVRLRFGDGLTSNSLLAGVNFGVRYPFSLDSGPLFCGYLEGGALVAVTGSTAVHVFVSAGIGFHF